MSKEPVNMILLEPYAESVTAMHGVLAKTNVAELMPVPSADEAWQAAQQFLPCILVVSIHGPDDGAPQLGMLRKLEKQIRSGQLKPLVIAKTKKHPLAREIAGLGVIDYVEEPVPMKSLLFKLKIMFQAINALKKRPGQDDEAIVIKAGAADEEDARATGNKELGYKPALQLSEDIFVFSGPPPLKGISGYQLEAEGPAPETGEWKAKPGADGKPAWQWVSKMGDEANDENSGWVHEGEEPEFDPVKNRWKLRSKKPRLAFWRNGREEATKVETDAEGKVLLAEDSKTARENLTLNRTMAVQAKEKEVNRVLREQMRGVKDAGKTGGPEAEPATPATPEAKKPRAETKAEKELADVWKKLADEAQHGKERAPRKKENEEKPEEEDLYKVRKKEKRAAATNKELAPVEETDEENPAPIAAAPDEGARPSLTIHETEKEEEKEHRDRTSEGEAEALLEAKAHEARPAAQPGPRERPVLQQEEDAETLRAQDFEPAEDALKNAFRKAPTRTRARAKSSREPDEPRVPREQRRRERRNAGRAKALKRARSRAERLLEEAEQAEHEAEALEAEQLEEQLAELEQESGPEAEAQADRKREDRARKIRALRERAAAARRKLEDVESAISAHESMEEDSLEPVVHDPGEEAERNFRAIETMSEEMAEEYLGKKARKPNAKKEKAAEDGGELPAEAGLGEELAFAEDEEAPKPGGKAAHKRKNVTPGASDVPAEESAEPDFADNVVELRPERRSPKNKFLREEEATPKAKVELKPAESDEKRAAVAGTSFADLFEGDRGAAPGPTKAKVEAVEKRELSQELQDLLGLNEETAATPSPLPPPPRPWKTAELLLLVEIADAAHEAGADPERLLAALRAALPGCECRFEPKRALEDLVPNRDDSAVPESGWPAGERGTLYVRAPEAREFTEREKLLVRSASDALAVDTTSAARKAV